MSIRRQLIRLRNALHPLNRRKLSGGGKVRGDANLLNTQISILGKSEVNFLGVPRLMRLSIDIRGGGKKLIVGPRSKVSGCIELHGDNNLIEIGADVTINGAFLGAHNGTAIRIGDNCLFSTDIDVRTTDSHKIFDQDDNQINSDRDVFIGEKVWLGRGVSVLKGASIGSGSVIGAMSVCAGKIESHAIYAGVPARKLKNNIYWEQ